MAVPSHCYRLHGVRIASELELPELVHDPGQAAAEVTMRWGSTPAQLHNVTGSVGSVQATANRLLFTLAGTARYLVESGSEIIIESEPGADLETVRMFLLGTAWAACCHQRGLLLMHASVARIGNVTVAFIGPSGSGKSTVAALLASRGYTIASDDTCIITLDAGSPWIVPGYPRLKLWSDALDILPAAAALAQPAVLQPGKFKLPLTTQWRAEPNALDHVLELADDRDGTPLGFAPLNAVESIQVLARNTFRPELLRQQGRQIENFHACADVARAVRVHRWVRPWGAANRRKVIHMLERWLAADAQPAFSKPQGTHAPLLDSSQLMR
jgi:hypothetical protein